MMPPRHGRQLPGTSGSIHLWQQAFLLRGLVILLDDEMGEIDLSGNGPVTIEGTTGMSQKSLSGDVDIVCAFFHLSAGHPTKSKLGLSGRRILWNLQALQLKARAGAE